MKKLDAVLLKAFLYGLPVVIVYGISVCLYDLATAAQAGGYAKAVYDLGGFYIFGSWLLISIYLSIKLMVSGLFRRKVLTKLTFIKERDEREVILTGQSAKTTMLTTVAILIFLFFLSCLRFSFYHVPPEQAIDGKPRVLSFGLSFALLEQSHQKNLDEAMKEEHIISYTGLPVSSSAVILGLILWQIISYNYSMQRLMK